MTNYTMMPARQWWAQQWIDVLENFGWRRRLERARNYARQGNVLSIDFKGHKVFAKVQGTAPEPYDVSFHLDRFSDEEWEFVIETMSQRAVFSAKLLAGEMPHNIDEVFTANGLSLFPLTKFDLHSHCSCPDKARLCKHLGAVYYLLGDRFDEDPFVLFQLRGRTKDEIIAALRQSREESNRIANGEETDAETAQPSPASDRAASPINLETFWQYDRQLESSLVVIAPPPDSKTVLDVLGAIPLQSTTSKARSRSLAEQPIREYLDSVYQTVSQHAMLAAMAKDR